MGKKRIAAIHLHGENYKTLKTMEICDDLVVPSPVPFPLSPTAEDNSKLLAREVYLKIIEGTFRIAPPEKTETTRNSVSKC